MKMHIKRFLEWIQLKEKLHNIHSKAPYLNAGDIWWASIGENLGFEINGKSSLFSRPVIILKKLSRHLYFVIPTTSKVKKGSWYVPFIHKNRKMHACLHQARSIDYRRLSNKMGELNGMDFNRVKDQFKKLYP